ncbi:formyltransferase family protein [Aquimarina sp. 2201CG1-2-11]|uniref:methionyl-tRNA formyltransferase n=1 Tax=Aquimarina discodermiae TaxID=3231043 RepID=UPI0034631F55
MKVILIGNFPTSISLYNYLSTNELLTGVCFQESNNLLSDQISWKNSIQKDGYKTFSTNKQNLNKEFISWLREQAPDIVLVCGFSLKIPKDALLIPTYGFLNIHFGKLPVNRGPDPLFWSIKNQEKNTAITIHQMDENWDTGKILLEHSTPIIPGETMGMLNSKMSYALSEIIEKAIRLGVSNENYKPQSLDKPHNYRFAPNLSETTIIWEEQTADDIENLVNACNPKYGGATTYYQGSPIKILEVSPVNGQVPLLGKTPGEIVHAHPQEGLFICCKYGKLLKINIISSDAGILTGNKYVHLGLRQGQLFTSQLKTLSMQV